MSSPESLVRGRFGSATFGAPQPEPPAVPEPAPAPARRSTRTRVLLALLLVAVVLGALLGGLALGGRGQVRVWQLRHDVAAGAAVGVADLRPVEVSGQAAPGALPVDRRPAGVARESLRAGELLPADLLVPGTPLPGPGQVLVGVATPPGGAPMGLRPGDVVTVFSLPASGSGTPQVDVRRAVTVLLVGAEVYAVAPGTGGQVLTLVVPAARAAEVVGLGAQQRLAVALRP